MQTNQEPDHFNATKNVTVVPWLVKLLYLYSVLR